VYRPLPGSIDRSAAPPHLARRVLAVVDIQRTFPTTFHQQGTAMIQSDYPNIITFVAGPSPGTAGSTDDPFINAALATIGSKKAPRNRIVKVSSVRDIDVELSAILSDRLKGQIRVQIIGHSLSGGLALGAFWIPAAEVHARAFKFPYYILDTNPAPLGLLSKHAGKISELMLVGCNIGSANSVGYPINGRTLAAKVMLFPLRVSSVPRVTTSL
jgi:hypothetical protein